MATIRETEALLEAVIILIERVQNMEQVKQDIKRLQDVLENGTKKGPAESSSEAKN